VYTSVLFGSGNLILIIVGLKAVIDARKGLHALATVYKQELDELVTRAQDIAEQAAQSAKQASLSNRQSQQHLQEASVSKTLAHGYVKQAAEHVAECRDHVTKASQHADASKVASDAAEAHAQTAGNHVIAAETHAVAAELHAGLTVDAATKAESTKVANVCAKCKSLVARYDIVGGDVVCANCRVKRLR